MKHSKKGLIALLAVIAFVAVTAAFTDALQEQLFAKNNAVETVRDLSAFPRTVTEPVEPETVETEPTETEPTVPPTTEEREEETIPKETKPRHVYDTIPLFFMTDYPDILYRSGTLATSGSNIASLAMVASYLTGNEYRPDELAEYFADFIGNSMEWLEYASDELQLPWEKAENFHVAKQALQEGKIVITLLGGKSVFTQSQHFIVLTGINDAGKITVNDPYEDHYSQWNLKTGLSEGFGDSAILTGYQGSWIYDPGAMPEEPFVYEAEENTDEFRYPGVELTQEEKDLMAELIYMEAQSEPFEGQQAIAEVILNRLVADNFQNTVKGVILAEGQFKSANQLYAAKPTHTQYEAVERALYGPYVLPIDVVFFASYKVNDNVWGTIGAHTFCYQW